MNYLRIDKEDLCNGEGLRVVLWLSGCSHKCRGCQNPQTWDDNSGIPFDKSAKEELFKELDKDYISGLTLTGGDPLFESNLDSVLDLVKKINKRYNTQQNTSGNVNKTRLSIPRKTIWLYTGYEWQYVFDEQRQHHPQIQDKLSTDKWKRQQIISQCDVVIDGKYIDSERDISLKWRGSLNQNVIDVQKSLQQKKVVLWCN